MHRYVQSLLIKKKFSKIDLFFSQFVYKAAELGDPPSDDTALQEYYDRLCQLDDEFRSAIAPYLQSNGPWQLDKAPNCNERPTDIV